MKTTKLNEHHKVLTFKDIKALNEYILRNFLKGIYR